jgi:hypothetical protein
MTNSTLYICGDSFCTEDLSHGTSWVGLLKDALPNINIVNLASPGASNYLISLQVQHALDNKCDYLIYHATSSIRNEFQIGTSDHKKDHIERYWHPDDQNNKSVLSTSWISATRNTSDVMLDHNNTIKGFFTNHVDFLSMVRKNYIFIDYTLKIIRSKMGNTNWLWSRGGFEHYKFSESQSWNFSSYQVEESTINLWDDFDHDLLRPYYHVTDFTIHQRVCNLYLDMLKLTN